MATIRTIVEADRREWVRLRDALWPGSPADHEEETRRYFESGMTVPVVFVAEADGRIVGFLELDFRKYAPGCRSSPVPFVEGWYGSSVSAARSCASRNAAFAPGDRGSRGRKMRA